MKRLTVVFALVVLSVCICGCQPSAQSAGHAAAMDALARARRIAAQAAAITPVAPREDLPAFRLYGASNTPLLDDDQMKRIVDAVGKEDPGAFVQVVKEVASEKGVKWELLEEQVEHGPAALLAEFGRIVASDPDPAQDPDLLEDEPRWNPNRQTGRRWGWALASPDFVSGWTTAAEKQLGEAEKVLTDALQQGLSAEDKALVQAAIADVYARRARIRTAQMAEAKAALNHGHRALLAVHGKVKGVSAELDPLEADDLPARIRKLSTELPTWRTQQQAKQAKADSLSRDSQSKTDQAQAESAKASSLYVQADKIRQQAYATPGEEGKKLFEKANDLGAQAAAAQKRADDLKREGQQLSVEAEANADGAAALKAQILSRVRFIAGLLPQELIGIDLQAEPSEQDVATVLAPAWLAGKVSAALKDRDDKLAALRGTRARAVTDLKQQVSAVQQTNKRIGQAACDAAEQYAQALEWYRKAGELNRDEIAKAAIVDEAQVLDSIASTARVVENRVPWRVSGKAQDMAVGLADGLAAAAGDAGRFLDQFATVVTSNGPVNQAVQRELPGAWLLAPLPKAPKADSLVPVSLDVAAVRRSAVVLLRASAKFQWVGLKAVKPRRDDKPAQVRRTGQRRLEMLRGLAETYLALHGVYQCSGFPEAPVETGKYKTFAQYHLTDAVDLAKETPREDVKKVLAALESGTWPPVRAYVQPPPASAGGPAPPAPTPMPPPPTPPTPAPTPPTPAPTPAPTPPTPPPAPSGP
jgi:hypothetical protein